MNRKLFTVGPVEVREEVLRAMTRPMIVHRGADYERLQRGIVEKIRMALDTDMEILMAPSSASGLLEACVRCGVASKMTGVANGSFGERWQSIGTANGKEVQRIEVPWGRAVRRADLMDRLEPDSEAVSIVANESSTGVLNPLPEIVEEARGGQNRLVLVDAVTAAFGIDLALRKLEADAVVFGTQKALALPPGLAIVCASDRLLEKAKRVRNRGYYFDLLEMKMFADKNLPVTTPPVSLMYALDFQLDRILEEGMGNRLRRHRAMADMVRSWAERRFSLFAEAGYRSDTITVISKGSLDFGSLQLGLNARGFEISAGYGKIKETTFRIGHMGDLTVEEVKDLLAAMDGVLEELT